MPEQPTKLIKTVAGVLFCIGVYLVAVLCFYISQAGTPLSQVNLLVKPGAFLFFGFSLAAFYVPAFVFICAYYLGLRPLIKNRFAPLNLTIIPFLTFALFLKISTGTLPAFAWTNNFFDQAYGKLLGSAFCLALFILEIILLSKFIRKRTRLTQQSFLNNRASVREKQKKQAKTNYNLENETTGNPKRQFILELNRWQENKQEQQSFIAKQNQMKSKESGKRVPLAALKPKKSRTSALALAPPPRQNKTGIRSQKESPALLKDSRSESMETISENRFGAPDDETIYEILVEPGQDKAHNNTGFYQEEKIIRLDQKMSFPDQAAEDLPPEADLIIQESDCEVEDLEPLEVTEKAETDTAEKTDAHLKIQPEENEIEPKPQEVVNRKSAGEFPPVKKKNNGPYTVPLTGILNEYDNGQYWQIDPQTRESGEVLMNTLKEFKINAEVTGIRKGPVITMFEILPAPGVKLSKIVNLADNIALRLAASTVRIVAPIPGKHAVGIEVPNHKRAIVGFKELIELDIFQKGKYEIPIVIGKDIAGGAQIIDLVQTPHLLIAGATGSGKSVCVNSIISSVLYSRSPAQVKLLLIDPKIVELKFYNDIPHLLTPVITTPKRAFQALQYCLFEMERRYSLLDAIGVRDIKSFNKKVKTKKLTTSPIPYMVIVIDEFADLIATSGKEMEATIARLAAMSRAVGIHLVLATQRPSVEVITGLIKANIPSRIAFMVASKFDSRIIIDAVGAEKLLGKGDMLLSSAWDPVPIRIQGTFLSEEEVEALTEHVKTLGEPDYLDEEMFFADDEDDLEGNFAGDSDDPLFDKALDIIVAQGKASASYLQRKLKIGYNRAARLVENMEIRGIVGPANGSKPRELLHIPDRVK